MNREILFRGKRVDNGKWVEGELLHDMKNRPWIYWTTPKELTVFFSKNAIVNPETIGQYTGKTDKNGNKIFEGSIIKYTNNQKGVYEIGKKMKGFVCFDENIGCYISKNNFQKHADFWFASDIEVIGNIHDNPELLEDEE